MMKQLSYLIQMIKPAWTTDSMTALFYGVILKSSFSYMMIQYFLAAAVVLYSSDQNGKI